MINKQPKIAKYYLLIVIILQSKIIKQIICSLKVYQTLLKQHTSLTLVVIKEFHRLRQINLLMLQVHKLIAKKLHKNPFNNQNLKQMSH